MKYLMLVLSLSVSSSVYAGGSWGGGTPPASAVVYSLYSGMGGEPLTMQGTLLQLEDANIPRVRSATFTVTDDGYTLIPIGPEAAEMMLKQARRRGSAGVLVDTGKILKFFYLDGVFEDAENSARIVVETP